jgi:hypothetical protein
LVALLSLTVTLIVASLPQSNYLPPLREIFFCRPKSTALQS